MDLNIMLYRFLFLSSGKIESDIFYLDTFIQYNSNITLNTRYLHWIQLNKTLTRFGYHTGSNLTVTSLGQVNML